MSLTQFNMKYEALLRKEMEINKYYDPASKKSKKHRHLDDIHKDILEDLDNFGFARFSWKVTKGQTYGKGGTNTDQNQKSQTALTVPSQTQQTPLDKKISNQVQLQAKMLEHLGKHKGRPQTAQIQHKQQQDRLRPHTAVFQRKQQQQDRLLKVDAKFQSKLLQEQQQQEAQQSIMKKQVMSQFEQFKAIKVSQFWKNTAKFVQHKELIRNESALSPLNFEHQSAQAIQTKTNISTNKEPQLQFQTPEAEADIQQLYKINLGDINKQKNNEEQCHMAQKLRESWIGADMGSAESHIFNVKKPFTEEDRASLKQQYQESLLTVHNVRNKQHAESSSLLPYEEDKDIEVELNLKEASTNRLNLNLNLTAAENKKQTMEKDQGITVSNYMRKKEADLQQKEYLKQMSVVRHRTKEQQLYFEANYKNDSKLILTFLNKMKELVFQNMASHDLHYQDNPQPSQNSNPNNVPIVSEKSKLSPLSQIKLKQQTSLLSIFDIKWSRLIQSTELAEEQQGTASLVIIDLNSMNILSFPKVSIQSDTDQLAVVFKQMRFEVDFRKAFEELKRHRANINNFNLPECYYVALFKPSEMLFEMFCYQGCISPQIEPRLMDCLLAFYMRFLELFDQKRIFVSVDELITNSLLVLVQRQQLKQDFSSFLSKLQHKHIFVQDQSHVINLFIAPLFQQRLSMQSQQEAYTQAFNASQTKQNYHLHLNSNNNVSDMKGGHNDLSADYSKTKILPYKEESLQSLLSMYSRDTGNSPDGKKGTRLARPQTAGAIKGSANANVDMNSECNQNRDHFVLQQFMNQQFRNNENLVYRKQIEDVAMPLQEHAVQVQGRQRPLSSSNIHFQKGYQHLTPFERRAQILQQQAHLQKQLFGGKESTESVVGINNQQQQQSHSQNVTQQFMQDSSGAVVSGVRRVASAKNVNSFYRKRQTVPSMPIADPNKQILIIGSKFNL